MLWVDKLTSGSAAATRKACAAICGEQPGEQLQVASNLLVAADLHAIFPRI